ncbi:restriction endonuclease subunit S [Roseovarius sp. 10]|uniref:restriction endonuclease subunit S n=1 Tax=Roseovarius sp. 10 TaxID=3080563 RepID=UPI002954D9E5|nr:restriction endonuclease subunit S [Roseovarius sp. 10]MDV7201122.1 restriction endonuclease subunit S [Roseovarius sp. 10]
MKVGWKAAQIGDVCTVVAGQSPSGSAYNDQGVGLPFYQGKKEFRDRLIGPPTTWTSVVTKEGLPGDILMSVRAPVGPINMATQRICIGRGLAAIRAKEGLIRDFLWYALLWLQPTIRGSSGAVFDSINKAGIEGLSIPLPPFEEQQRIVAVLDEAFEGLARARSYAEANLQSASELFSSTLIRALQSGNSDWQKLAVAETMTRTKVPSKIQRKAYLAEGTFPIVSQETGLINGYWNNESDVVHVKRPVVVFGDHTRILKYVDFDFVVGADGTQIMAPIERLDPKYYYYALKTINLEGKGYARHFSHLKKCEIVFPVSIQSQRNIAAELDRLSESVQRLERQYVRTIGDLDELRQSLLQKAFTGELTQRNNRSI